MSKIKRRLWMLLAMTFVFTVPVAANAQAECQADEDCPDGEICFDGACEDDGGDALIEENACDIFFECIQEIDCDGPECAGPCLELIEGEERAVLETLFACFEESGCDVDDDVCVEEACAEELEELVLICGGDIGDEDPEEPDEPIDEPSVCDEIFECLEETCGGEPDFECLQACAAEADEPLSSVATAAFDCAAESGCTFEEDECIEDACADELEALEALCEGSDGGDPIVDENNNEPDNEEGGFNNEPGEPEEGSGGTLDSSCSTVGGPGQLNAVFILLIGLFIGVARRRQ